MLVTITSPVTAHMTTVSQKTAVMEIRLCLLGSLVSEEAAAMAAVPMPASLVNSPLAMPKRAALCSVLPIKPACGRFCPEGAAYNQRYSGEQEIPVQDKQIQTTGNIEEAQSRNHAGTEFADGFDTAQNDQAGGKCCQNANDMR